MEPGWSPAGDCAEIVRSKVKHDATNVKYCVNMAGNMERAFGGRSCSTSIDCSLGSMAGADDACFLSV